MDFKEKFYENRVTAHFTERIEARSLVTLEIIPFPIST